MTDDPSASHAAEGLDTEFQARLGLFDSTMFVIGSMIGSGIFVVSAEMSRFVGSPGWLLVAWMVTGVLTVVGALTYGELAAMMPRAGGQYVYLREAFSPLWGFLYGWTLFLVIQTGIIAAVAVAFARFSGVLWPSISETNYLLPPIHLTERYAISLSTAQLLAIGTILLLTWSNTRGLRFGKLVQNFFGVSKSAAMLVLIAVGLTLGWNAEAVSANFGDFWSIRGEQPVAEGITAATAFGLFIALCVSQTGSLFSSDCWNNITFAAGEVREPRRNLPLALVLGTGIVIALYLLTNLAYLVVLPLEAIQSAEEDRVATAMMERILPGKAVSLMAAAIMVSTFGCNNGLILAGARTYYAMARDGLFFRGAGRLNEVRVPAAALVFQGAWTAFLVLPRVYDPAAGKYGNLYGNLLDYVMSAALLFYILTVLGVFVLRRTRPDAPRPYRAFGYPLVPALYVLGAGTILAALLAYRPATTWPGFAIVGLGLPVYCAWRRFGSPTAAYLETRE